MTIVPTLMAAVSLSAGAASPPKWVDHEVLVGGSKEAPILYGVGRQTASRFCDARWVTQTVNIAGSRARTAIGELLGRTHIRVEDSASVTATEVKINTKRSNNTGYEGERDDDIVTHDERLSTTVNKATGRGLRGVRALRAYYDPKTRSVYVLSAKKVSAAELEGLELEGLELEKLAKLEGMTLRQAEVAMAQHCGR